MGVEHSRSPQGVRASHRPWRLLPLWSCVALVACVLVAVIAAVATGVILLRPPPTQEEMMQSLCRSAAEARLERRVETDVTVSKSPEVTRTTDTEYRVQGKATFRDGDELSIIDLRCVLRKEDGRWRVSAVRFND